MQNSKLVKGSRYQNLLPESYFFKYRNDEAVQKARKDIEDYYDYHFPYTQEKIVEELMKYNNTRLQYLLKLYYQQNSNQGIYFIYKSAYKNGNNTHRLSESLLYKTLWTDVRDFFTVFHADFISTCYCYWFFDRNTENINTASKFCDDYFKWLSKNLAEKGEVSFEEVREKLRSMLKQA
jgi:3',5'-cyclic AMP phosphodiesterase CpdA